MILPLWGVDDEPPHVDRESAGRAAASGRLLRMVRAAVILIALVSAARAGGGPETTLVVFNRASAASRLVANEYRKARGVPDNRLVGVDGIPHLGVIPLDLFLERIWRPVAAHLVREGLDGQIDLITYSVDFPYGVDFRPRLGDRNNQVIGGIASLTGVTYLIRAVDNGDEFWNLEINKYYGLDLATGRKQPRRPTAEENASYQRAMAALQQKQYEQARANFADFLATYRDAAEPWYNYACVLALLGKPEEALLALAEAQAAGFAGAAHAAQDADLASLRERPEFKATLAKMGQWSPALRPAAGFSAVREGYFLSTQLGYTGRWGNSLPEVQECLRRAASCDGTRPDGTVYILRNGDVRSTSREPFFHALKTRLGELGRKVEQIDGVLPPQKPDVVGAVVGIAGFDWRQSGSTMLPGAIAEHLTSYGADFGHGGQTKISEFLRHGAAGSSGTVTEPLALHQKFPNPLVHAFYAEGLSLAEAFYRTVLGPYQLMVAGDGLARPFARFESVTMKAPPSPWSGTVGIEVEGARGRREVWVDGRRVALPLDTAKLDDGHHEVRAVVVSDDPTETRSAAISWVVVRNGGAEGVAKLVSKPTVTFGEPIIVETNGKEKRLTFASEALGPGPLLLRPRLTLSDGRPWLAAPIEVMVEMPEGVGEGKPGAGPTVPALRAVAEEVGGERAHLLGAKFGPIEARRVRIDGEIEAPADGFYQLLVSGNGTLTLTVAGQPLCKQAKLVDTLFLPMQLKKGWHPIALDLEPPVPARLELLLGGAVVLGEPALRHRHGTPLKEAPEIVGEDAAGPVKVHSGGIVLAWKKGTAAVSSIALTAAPDVKDFPAKWDVEVPAGSKWKPVKEAECLAAGGVVLIRMPVVKTKKLRLSAATPTTLASVECAGPLPKSKSR